MKSLILYWSSGGNTKKVADAISAQLREKGVSADMLAVTEELEVDLYSYDLVFFGAPSYQWIPPQPVQKFIKNTMNRYRKGVRPIGAPRVDKKFGVVFCTYCGVHTGIHEAIPAGKYMGQFFEHMGFFVLDEWYVPGKFQGWEEGSRLGKLGDLTNRPDENDLAFVSKSCGELLKGLEFLM